MFNISDTGEFKGRTITAREILDKDTQKIEQELSGQPETQAKLMAVIGEVYHRLGLYTEEHPLLQKSL